MCVIFFPKIMNNSIHVCFIISEIVYDIVKYVCANFGAFIVQFMIQRKIAWRPFLKEVPSQTQTQARTLAPQYLKMLARYMCTNFGAFIAKCTTNPTSGGSL